MLELEAGDYAVTVGDLADVTSDGRPLYREGNRAFVTRVATVSVTEDQEVFQVDAILDAHVDTTLRCRVSEGYRNDAECTGNGEYVVSDEHELDVSFQVVGRSLEISNQPSGLGRDCSVDGSRVRVSDGSAWADPFTNDTIVLQVITSDDCPPFIRWECPPPE